MGRRIISISIKQEKTSEQIATITSFKAAHELNMSIFEGKMSTENALHNFFLTQTTGQRL